MPSIQENLTVWNEADWSKYREGESWSGCWGGSEMLWHGSLYPRVHPFLPSSKILEIAPGHGRVTQYLRDWCDELHIVDLSPNCIQFCQQRFAGDNRFHYYVNDGLSLEMIPDGVFDFVICFDSLVHCEFEVVASYLKQLATKLTPNGVGFIHHSNLAEYMRRGLELLPQEILLQETANPGWRASTVDSAIVAELCRQFGMTAITQELFPWGEAKFFDHPICVDCMTTFTKQGSVWERPLVKFRNEKFQKEEAVYAKWLGDHYGLRSFMTKR